MWCLNVSVRSPDLILCRLLEAGRETASPSKAETKTGPAAAAVKADKRKFTLVGNFLEGTTNGNPALTARQRKGTDRKSLPGGNSGKFGLIRSYSAKFVCNSIKNVYLCSRFQGVFILLESFYIVG